MSLSEAYECTFNWTIENFSHCFKKNCEYILSPIFSSYIFNGRLWRMKLYPRGQEEDGDAKFISIYLAICDDRMDEEDIFVHEKWELVVQDTVLFIESSENERYKSYSFRGYNEFFSLKEIQDKIRECGEDKITILCHLSRSESHFCNAITRIIVDQYSFRWKILKPTTPDWLESKSVSLQESVQFQIDLTAPVDDVLIKIKLDIKSLSSVFLKCRLSLLNVMGDKIKSKFAEHLYDSSASATSWEFPSFFNKSQLEEENDNIFKDGTFTLDAEFSYSKDIDSYGNHVVSTLKDDLEEMLKSKKHSDIQLRSDNVMLPAHKCVLAARSPVFSVMFDQNMIENKSGIVDIVDCDSSTLKVFLEYLYNDALEISDSKTALKLLLVAEKYQVQSLKELCCSFLLANLTAENVCEILGVADMVKHEYLKFTALNFIKTNRRSVFSSAEGRKWIINNPNLAADILYFD